MEAAGDEGKALGTERSTEGLRQSLRIQKLKEELGAVSTDHKRPKSKGMK